MSMHMLHRMNPGSVDGVKHEVLQNKARTFKTVHVKPNFLKQAVYDPVTLFYFSQIPFK